MRRFGAALLFGWLAWGVFPAPAAAQTEGVQQSEEGDSEDAQSALAAGVVLAGGKDRSPFLLNTSLSTFLGQGTFVGGVQGNGQVSTQLNVSPAYTFNGWSLFASQTVAWEYTDPDNATGRRFEPFDPSVGVLVPLSIDAIDTRLQLVGGVRLPVSYASRAQGMYGGLFAGVTGVYRSPIKGLMVVLGLRGQVNGSSDSLRSDGGDSTFEDNTLGEVAIASCYARAGDDRADACGAVPVAALLSGRLALTYTTGKLSFVLGLSVISQIDGDLGPNDELTSDNARAGVNGTTFTSGTLAFNYAATPWLILGGGLTSFQPIQTADGQGMRFPFWNFSGANNNFSSFFASTTFIY